MFTGNESRRQISIEEDDDMLQYAITQSLLESGTEEDQVSRNFIYVFTQYNH